MAKSRKNQDLDYYDQVVSFLTSNERPRPRPRTAERRRGEQVAYYILRRRPTARPTTYSIHPLAPNASRPSLSSRDSRRTRMKSVRISRRVAGPATASRARTGAQRSTTVSQHDSVEDLMNPQFLKAVDSLELARDRFLERARAGSLTGEDDADAEPDPDADDPPCPTLTQMISQYFLGGLWTAYPMDEP